jgi:hypothetical protein
VGVEGGLGCGGRVGVGMVGEGERKEGVVDCLEDTVVAWREGEEVLVILVDNHIRPGIRRVNT